MPSPPAAAAAPHTGRCPGGCTPAGLRAARKRSSMVAPAGQRQFHHRQDHHMQYLHTQYHHMQYYRHLTSVSHHVAECDAMGTPTHSGSVATATCVLYQSWWPALCLTEMIATTVEFKLDIGSKGWIQWEAATGDTHTGAPCKRKTYGDMHGRASRARGRQSE